VYDILALQYYKVLDLPPATKLALAAAALLLAYVRARACVDMHAHTRTDAWRSALPLSHTAPR
jgi:hypothetical protein